LGSNPIIALICPETKHFVGFDGVIALILEIVGLDFADQTDTTIFLAQAEDNTRAFTSNPPKPSKSSKKNQHLPVRAATTASGPLASGPGWHLAKMHNRFLDPCTRD